MNMHLVGASLLAKIVNDNPGMLDERGVLGFFASKHAPTGDLCCWGYCL